MYKSNIRYKQLLHDLLQKHRKPLPTYECIIVGDSHCPRIGCKSVLFDGENFEVLPYFSKKKEAEQQVAKLMYESYVYKFPKEDTKKLVTVIKRTPNYKGQLQEICMKNYYSNPKYTTIQQGSPHIPQFKTTVEVSTRDGSNVIISTQTEKFHFKKNASETAAAGLAVSLLTKSSLQVNLFNLYNTKAQLIEYTRHNNMKLPEYKHSSEGKAHEPKWIATVTIASILYKSSKTCSTKKKAEENVAQVVLYSLEQQEHSLYSSNNESEDDIFSDNILPEINFILDKSLSSDKTSSLNNKYVIGEFPTDNQKLFSDDVLPESDFFLDELLPSDKTSSLINKGLLKRLSDLSYNINGEDSDSIEGEQFLFENNVIF